MSALRWKQMRQYGCTNNFELLLVSGLASGYLARSLDPVIFVPYCARLADRQ